MRKLFNGGEKIPTRCGRIIKFPITKGNAKQKIDQVNQWLIREAIKEAIWRGDQFNLLQHADLIGRTLHIADLDSLNLYLFGHEDGPQRVK